MKSAAGKRRWLKRPLFTIERDTLVKPPGLLPGFGFPAEKEMETDSGEKKQNEQEASSSPTLPYINANRDCEQYTVFDNPKPAGLRMERDVFFFPIEFSEGHSFCRRRGISVLGGTPGWLCRIFVPGSAVIFTARGFFVCATPLFEEKCRIMLAALGLDFPYPFLFDWT